MPTVKELEGDLPLFTAAQESGGLVGRTLGVLPAIAYQQNLLAGTFIAIDQAIQALEATGEYVLLAVAAQHRC